MTQTVPSNLTQCWRENGVKKSVVPLLWVQALPGAVEQEVTADEGARG